MKQKWTIMVLFVMIVVSLALFPGEAEDVEAQDAAATTFIYLPLARKDPHCDLYVDNRTGGQLCYEVKGTGIGRKCFSSGTHFYGSFAPGTYPWSVSKSPCGTGSGTAYYDPGEQHHEFWCN